jgi:hypothetical protein
MSKGRCDFQHNDTQHKGYFDSTQCYYECHIFIIALSAVLLSAVVLSVNLLGVIMLVSLN